MASTTEVATLEIRKAVTREISSQQKHYYQVTLTENQYASVTIEQRGIDLLVRLLGPDGKATLVFDEERSTRGNELLELVAETTGSYSFTVEAKLQNVPAGEYEVRLGEVRPATSKDRALQEARRLIAECVRLRLAGKYDEALVPGQQAFEIRQKELGPDHPDVAVALSSLAIVYRAKDDTMKAESLHRQALVIQEKVFGTDHPSVAATLNNLALILHFQKGDLDGAEQLYQRALAIWAKKLGPEHPYIPAVLNNIAMVYVDRGDFVKAEPLYEKALATQEKLLGGEHPDVGRSLNNLGELYRQMGDFDRARRAYERSLAIYEKALGREHPDVADLLGNLAIVYRHQHDYSRAEDLNRRALAIREKELGLEHSAVAASLNNLAVIYFEKGEYAKAEPLYKRALAIHERLLGPNHPEIIFPLNNLADLYALKGDLAEAASFLSRKLAVSEFNLAMNIATGSERQKLAYLATLSHETDGAISFHVRFAPDQIEAREIAVTTIMQRKGRVLDTMADTFSSLRRRSSVSDQAVVDRLSDTTSRLAKLVLNGPETTLDEHQQQIKLLEEEREKLEAQINRLSSGYYQRTQSVALADLQEAIPANGALIEFALYRPFNPKRTPVMRLTMWPTSCDRRAR